MGAGIVVNLCSAWHHARLVRRMNRGQAMRSHSVTLAVATALFLASVGLGMAIYLISVRKSANPHSGNVEEISMPAQHDNGILNKRSNYSVDETLERLKRALQAKGVTVFAVVDHSGEAEKVGLKMRPTKLVIFGSPKAGTSLMLAAPSSAIDLPLKILIWEGSEGKVWVSYNSPAYLQERHGLPQDLVKNIAVVEPFAGTAAE